MMSEPAIAETLCLRTRDGRTLALTADRWFAEASAAEQDALDHAIGPALDIGCGPGRHLVALGQREVFALGIDISPVFVDVARRRGVNVLERSVFHRVPGAGRWRSALLLDGNIGIGGDPALLLSRVLGLLATDGRIILEIEPEDGADDVVEVRAETPTSRGPWFRWTTVGPQRLAWVARSAHLDLVETWNADDRCFARLERHHRRRES
jgi:SAM-dependent methyltransferase